MKIVLFLSAIILSLFSCKDGQNMAQVKDLKARISDLESKLNDANIVEQGRLAHIVYLNLKEDISNVDQTKLIDAIEDLKNIKVIKKLHLGKIADTGDTRFISDHELMFQINVNDKNDLDVYQKDSIHLKLKSLAKGLLSEPPAVYDYWVY